MGFKVSYKGVEERLERFVQEVDSAQIKRLQALGNMCVEHARNIPYAQGFEDQTGNLRSSIGYMIFRDGVAVHSSDYETVKSGKDGAAAGRELAESVGKKTEGLCLVVTAGMNYALYVESGREIKSKDKDGNEVVRHTKGRDVLSSAELLAKRELPNMLRRLNENIGRL